MNMPRFPRLENAVRRRCVLPASLLAFAALSLAAREQTPVQVLDASALHPPAGARVAIVEFDDLQCPAWAAANPVLKAAAAQYKIPWIRHDFLIPYHNWSRQAAINARWFDLKSKSLGDEYRDQLFANQNSIYNPDTLNQFTQKFAQSHGVALPFAIDPQGKLQALVKADYALGQHVGSAPASRALQPFSSWPPTVRARRSRRCSTLRSSSTPTSTRHSPTPLRPPRPRPQENPVVADLELRHAQYIAIWVVEPGDPCAAGRIPDAE